MDDYSHCHFWDNKRPCIGFDCDDCDYKKEYHRINSTCHSARRLGYEGDADCENCSLCAHRGCIYDQVPCNSCEKCFEPFGIEKCETCIHFDSEQVFWAMHSDCRYEKKKGVVRPQKFWNEKEFDEDLFKL
jgi:hypothetical protein